MTIQLRSAQPTPPTWAAQVLPIIPRFAQDFPTQQADVELWTATAVHLDELLVFVEIGKKLDISCK